MCIAHNIRSRTTRRTDLQQSQNGTIDYIGDEEVRDLAEVLKFNTVSWIHSVSNIHPWYSMQALTSLNLDSQNITSIGAQYLAAALEHNQVGFVIIDFISERFLAP